MGAVTDRSNSITISCIYCCIVVGDYNLRSRVRGNHYRGKFQSWWVRYSTYINYE